MALFYTNGSSTLFPLVISLTITKFEYLLSSKMRHSFQSYIVVSGPYSLDVLHVCRPTVTGSRSETHTLPHVAYLLRSFLTKSLKKDAQQIVSYLGMICGASHFNVPTVEDERASSCPLDVQVCLLSHHTSPLTTYSFRGY